MNCSQPLVLEFLVLEDRWGLEVLIDQCYPAQGKAKKIIKNKQQQKNNTSTNVVPKMENYMNTIEMNKENLMFPAKVKEQGI